MLQLENLGFYFNKFGGWVKDGWKFLFEDTKKIQAHHLIAFLLTILIIHLLSYIISKIFKTLMKICILIATIWLTLMLLFDRKKFQELFGKEGITQD